MSRTASRFAILMGSASFLTLTTLVSAKAQEAPAPIEEVLVTGSLIHGAAAVGVPVTQLGSSDLIEAGAVSIADLFRTAVPSATVAPGPSAVNMGSQQQRLIRVNFRNLDKDAVRALMLVDGVRWPAQGDQLNVLDPSIIPTLAIGRVDILTDGASATYGSDAISGVLNIVLKRKFNGATTLLRYSQPDEGGQTVTASQLFGRTWDGLADLGPGGITLTYEFTNSNEVPGTAHDNFTVDYTPWGLDDQRQLVDSVPGTITTGAPAGMAPGGVGTICSNCWKVPAGAGRDFDASLNNGLGPLAPSSAAPINWATLIANPANFGTNIVDPMKLGWEVAALQRNSFVLTFDQQIFPGVSLFASGFDHNLRVSMLAPPYNSNATTATRTVVVATTNPYYPTNAPNNLRVSYDIGAEIPLRLASKEVSYRWQAGLNLELPFDWVGQVYYAYSSEGGGYTRTLINQNALTVAAGTPTGGISKPANVPYLNLFCDATVYQCNSPITLAYVTAYRESNSYTKFAERTARFDGPLFDLPAGPVRAAVGGGYESHDLANIIANNSANQPSGSPLVRTATYISTNVWAVYGQLNVPIFGDDFNLPLFRKLDLEISARHDTYHGANVGSTDNPRIAATWLLDEMTGATVRGSWGTSFRFAGPVEASSSISDSFASFNVSGGTSIALPCVGGAPAAGSVAANLFAAGFTCNSMPGGLEWGGAPHPELRGFTNASTGQTEARMGGVNLAPEKSKNYSLGFGLAPQVSFLRGLDLELTWYKVKIDHPLTGSAAVNAGTLGDANVRYRYMVPSDLGCPVAANANPTSCAPFEAMAAAILASRNSTQPLTLLSSIYWLNDGGTIGSGSREVEGLDWVASYDFDADKYGIWNAGITGSYYLHDLSQADVGAEVVDFFHQDIGSVGGIPQNGVEQLPRLQYRTRLGWTDGTYSVTGFVNFQSHYFAAQLPVPPNVNYQCTTAGGTVGGGSQLCAISNYSNIMPSRFTIDLSFGYNSGDEPTNDYLKNIAIQLTIQNVMGTHPAFMYRPSTTNGNPAAYDILKPNTGRVLGLTLVKNW